MTCFEWATVIVNTFVAAGTIFIAILAIYGDKIRSWLIRPKLRILVSSDAPNILSWQSQETEASASSSEFNHVVRLKVVNQGKGTAKRCKVVLEEMQEKLPAEHYNSIAQHEPMCLRWANSDLEYLDILSGKYAFCEVGRIMPESQRSSGGAISDSYKFFYSVISQVPPGACPHLFTKKLSHRVSISVTPENGKETRVYLEIFYSGNKIDKNIDIKDLFIKEISEGEMGVS